jgi:hypothetical protein
VVATKYKNAVSLRIWSGASAKEKLLVAAVERYTKARVEHSWMGSKHLNEHGAIERELREAEARLMSRLTDGSLW